jgi:tRNA pseudouridine38-40 synthase
MSCFKLTLAYDGTGLVGWQRQAAGVSVQGLLEDALRELAGASVTVIGAGRTDAGVHALGQVASVSLDRAIPPDALVRALNARLPDSVRVLAAEEAPAAFHARFGAQAKTYCYRIWHGDVISPFEQRYAWHVKGALDVDRMDLAASLIEGQHDFAAFQASGGTAGTTERRVSRSCMTIGGPDEVGRVVAWSGSPAARGRAGRPHGGPDLPGRLIAYEISGNGFLRHMVRNIVGTLVEIGRRRRPADWIEEVLESRDRARAGPTAPPGGLFLVSVSYDALACG